MTKNNRKTKSTLFTANFFTIAQSKRVQNTISKVVEMKSYHSFPQSGNSGMKLNGTYLNRETFSMMMTIFNFVFFHSENPNSKYHNAAKYIKYLQLVDNGHSAPWWELSWMKGAPINKRKKIELRNKINSTILYNNKPYEWSGLILSARNWLTDCDTRIALGPNSKRYGINRNAFVTGTNQTFNIMTVEC